MVNYETETCAGMRCPNCGWGWVTTKTDPVDLNETIYIVTMKKTENPSNTELKTVSKILNVNYLTASNLLKEGKASFSGKALEVLPKLKELSHNSFSFLVSPPFPYSW